MTIDSIGMLSNTLLIIAILVDPLSKLRKGAWVTILNLAVADFIASASNFMHNGLVGREFSSEQNRTAIRVASFFWMFGTSASFLLLTLLTVQTYLIVKYPIKSRLMLTGTKIASLCLCIWLFSVPMGLSNIPYALNDSFTFRHFMYTYVAQIAVLELAVVIQVVLKVLLVRQILKSRRNTEVSVQYQNNKYKDIAKTIVILNIILVVTAFPYFVAKQLEFLHKLDLVFPGESFLLSFGLYYEPVATINFAVNPILYSLRWPDYRRSLLALLRCWFPSKARKRAVLNGTVRSTSLSLRNRDQNTNV